MEHIWANVKFRIKNTLIIASISWLEGSIRTMDTVSRCMHRLLACFKVSTPSQTHRFPKRMRALASTFYPRPRGHNSKHLSDRNKSTCLRST